MSISKWSAYLNRSGKILRDGSSKILRMSGTDEPSRAPLSLFTFNSREDISQFATGSDADVGGFSTAHLALDESHLSPSGKPTGKFWGEMKLGVRPGLQGRIRAGYAGFRNKRRPTLFGEMVEDISNHSYLALRLRLGGHPRTRNSFYVNVQTDGPVTSDLWQHRLYFRNNDGNWENIFIPLQRFVLTNSGALVDHQVSMMRDRVRSVGISLLGGNSGVEGKYELGIDEVWAVNREDVEPEHLVGGDEPSNGTQWERGPL